MTPLAELLRPHSLDTYVGQSHLVAKGAVLRSLIESGNLPSMILWGPPGTGKTTLATIISHTLQRPFHTLSAISSGVKEVREVLDKAKQEQGSILFIDEIHRFNKAQQDSLLGATTENPSFEVISALLSRCQVYVLKPFNEEDMHHLIDRAVQHYASEGRHIEVAETDALMRISGGDARKLLNAIELVVNRSNIDPLVIDNHRTVEVIQQNLAYYDKLGETHYDIISAFIKSMRGSDPNGAVYWLARMIAGGEDPLFIARRMLIFASEDIGNANPNALLLANATFDAVSKIGYHECRINLSQCAIYLACSEKSNATYIALAHAETAIRHTGDLPVPLHIRNAPTKLLKDLDYGKNYKYAHDYDGNFAMQEYLPDGLQGSTFYMPGQTAREQDTLRRLHTLWNGKYQY